MTQFRQRQVPCNITYMWYLKYDTNEPIYEMERESGQRSLVVTRGKWVGKGMEWAVGISRCKLLCRVWINNKVLLYSKGNYIQYPVINCNGKEYIYITESLCHTAEIDTTLQINSSLIKINKFPRSFQINDL